MIQGSWFDGIPLYARVDETLRARVTDIVLRCGADTAAPLLSSSGWTTVGKALASEVLVEAEQSLLTIGQLLGTTPRRDLESVMEPEVLVLMQAEGLANWADLEHALPHELAHRVGSPAVQVVLAAWIAALGTEAHPQPDLLSEPEPIYSALTSVFRCAGNVRALNVWWMRSLGLNRGPTLREVGKAIGVSGARAQQLDAEGRQAGRRILQRLAMGPVGVAAEQLHAALGPVFPLDLLSWPLVGLTPTIGETDAQVIELGPPQVGLLLLRLAGPYTQHGVWLHRSDERWNADRYAIRQEILEQAASSLSTEQAYELLAESGVVEPAREPLLSSFEGIVQIAGHVHPWPDDAAGRMETVLRANGAPMSKTALARLIQRNVGTVSNILMTSERFARLDQDLFGLADWPGDRYAGVVEAIESAIGASGGVATSQAIFDYVLARFSVAENSIRTYLNSPEFVRINGGQYRIRGRSEPARVSTSVTLEESATCFRLPWGWALRMRVNDDRVRGSGLGITQAFAAHVGLEPGGVFTRAVVGAETGAPLGWVRFSWPRGQMPAVGSVSQFLTLPQFRWRLGDWLFLVWDVQHQVIRILVGEADGSSRLTEQTVCARIGAAIGRPDLAQAAPPSALRALADALGLPPEAGRSLVIQRLRVRKDEELIADCRVLYDLEAMRMETSA
jgi:hypothetical protein